MDTRGQQDEKTTPGEAAARAAVNVAAQIDAIRRQMPATYKAIQAQAAPDQLGAQAYALVRRALRGEQNCFFATEGGRVAGTPFTLPGVMQDVLAWMAEFGAPVVVVWPTPPQGVHHGA